MRPVSATAARAAAGLAGGIDTDSASGLAAAAATALAAPLASVRVAVATGHVAALVAAAAIAVALAGWSPPALGSEHRTATESVAHAAAGLAPDFARAWVLEVDGVRRAGRNVDARRAPASLTKMMGGLLIVEAAPARRLDAVQRISRHAAAATGSKLGLRAGESVSVADLLTAMLAASSNDACRALAEWHSGTEAAFVVRMNARARQMGLRRTHFVNACGHDAPGHLSTAGDLAILARAVMAAPEYARRAGLRETRIRTLAGSRQAARDLLAANHNHLIGRLDGAIGVKSGFTAQAGKCLAAMAERNGHRVLLVMLDARNRWWDAHAALDYALTHAPGAP